MIKRDTKYVFHRVQYEKLVTMETRLKIECPNCCNFIALWYKVKLTKYQRPAACVENGVNKNVLGGGGGIRPPPGQIGLNCTLWEHSHVSCLCSLACITLRRQYSTRLLNSSSESLSVSLVFFGISKQLWGNFFSCTRIFTSGAPRATHFIRNGWSSGRFCWVVM